MHDWFWEWDPILWISTLIGWELTNLWSQTAHVVLCAAHLQIACPIVSMYGIFSYIYHTNQPNVGIYIPYMDPMGVGYILFTWDIKISSKLQHLDSPIYWYLNPKDPGSPNLRWWARGVFHHLRNEGYSGSITILSFGDWIPRETWLILRMEEMPTNQPKTRKFMKPAVRCSIEHMTA